MTDAEALKFVSTPEGLATLLIGIKARVCDALPPSRPRSMVITKVDEAMLWLSIIGSGAEGFE